MGKRAPKLGVGNSFADPTRGATDDAANLQAVGAAHFSVLKAAFVCELASPIDGLWTAPA